MTRSISLGYSPCPNDTFIFDALIHRRIPLSDLIFRERIEDVETLNALALAEELDLTKVSYHALGHLRRNYALLRSGGALGRGCGPLVVATSPLTMEQLRHGKIAIPGNLTTANLLLQLYGEGFEQVVPMPFDRIMGTVARGDIPAGVIIHESRFTYQQLGLHQILDLGQWWEETTGKPIPLGGILIKRALGKTLIREIDEILRRSIEFAFAHPTLSRPYIKTHAQELSDAVIDNHIQLYVNDFSLDLGEEGLDAVTYLLNQAEQRGLIPPCDLPLVESSP
ncbi:MAG: 1,4-dihydroxy-6-naphthoate synthase [Desulfuromonadaceae bacterium]